MKSEITKLKFTMKTNVLLGCLLLAIGGLTRPAQAEVPEPDNLIYGAIQFGISPVTSANTNIFVEARKASSNGPVVATYYMGESSRAGNFYSLRIPIEAFNPLTDTNASRVGGLIHLSVRDASGVRVTKTASIAARGKLLRVDFTQLDTDGDGLPDTWEQQYFGNPTNALVNIDTDNDDRNNLDEFLAGTNPLIPDGRHPADSAPANNFMTPTEADDYATAWLTGAPWPNAPTNVPIAYVTKAALLALHGGTYVFTNSPPTNAPHWWVNIPRPPTHAPGTNFITSTMPDALPPGASFTVTLHALPHQGISVYAVEDRVPAGWQIASISHGGSLDEINRKIKWGPFYDNGERELTYDVTPAGTNTSATLVGTGSFDGFNVPITGNRYLSIETGSLPLRWATTRAKGQPPVLVLRGESSTTYVIEVSTNLTQWEVLRTISTDPVGRYFLNASNSPAEDRQFYRARTP